MEVSMMEVSVEIAIKTLTRLSLQKLRNDGLSVFLL